MPRNLPSRNWRRDTGLLIRVTAVRPSISSLIDWLAAMAPNRAAASIMVSKPRSFTMTRSSPKVKYGTIGETTRASRPKRNSTQNIGWRKPSRKAAKATAPPLGHTHISSGKPRMKKSTISWICNRKPARPPTVSRVVRS